VEKLCYICGNKAYVYVGEGNYRCYRDKCVHREKESEDSQAKKRMCFVCGKEGYKYIAIGKELYRCKREKCSHFVISYLGMSFSEKEQFKLNGIWKQGAPAPTHPINLAAIKAPIKIGKSKTKTEIMEEILIKGGCTIEELVRKSEAGRDTVEGMLGSKWGTGFEKMGYKVIKTDNTYQIVKVMEEHK